MKTKLSKVSSKYGAQMGRPNRIPKDIVTVGKLYIEKLRWVNGDYDQGGAYWGGGRGDDIYRVSGETKTEQVEIFVRAKSRNEAEMEIKRTLAE